MGINIRARLVNYELDQMSGYLNLIQEALSQRLEKVEAAYREDMTDEMTEHEYSMLEDHYTDLFLETDRDFPQRLLSSFVVAWYSFVEQQLLDICEHLDLRVTVGPKDNKNFGKGIRRARRFLLEGNQYEIHPPHWQELVEIGWLRNFIVHEGTKVMGNYYPSEEGIALQSDVGNTFYFPIRKDLFRYLQKHDLVVHSGVSLNIIPSFSYCNYLVDFGKELFGKLYTDLNLSKP
jgi:hypothetical protein